MKLNMVAIKPYQDLAKKIINKTVISLSEGTLDGISFNNCQSLFDIEEIACQLSNDEAEIKDIVISKAIISATSMYDFEVIMNEDISNSKNYIYYLEQMITTPLEGKEVISKLIQRHYKLDSISFEDFDGMITYFIESSPELQKKYTALLTRNSEFDKIFMKELTKAANGTKLILK